MTIRRLTALIALGILCTATWRAPATTRPTPTATAASDSVDASTFAAQVASTDLAAGRDERFQVGVVSSTQDAGVESLSYGSVQLTFAFLGADGSEPAQAGPRTTASYLPAPGTDDSGTEPTLTNPSESRGVYQAEDVRFDHAGVWQVTVATDVADLGALSLERTSS